jgi:hypothetical protein
MFARLRRYVNTHSTSWLGYGDEVQSNDNLVLKFQHFGDVQETIGALRDSTQAKFIALWRRGRTNVKALQKQEIRSAAIQKSYLQLMHRITSLAAAACEPESDETTLAPMFGAAVKMAEKTNRDLEQLEKALDELLTAL